MTDTTKYIVQGITKCGNTVTFEEVEMDQATLQTIAGSVADCYSEGKIGYLTVGLTIVNVLEIAAIRFIEVE